ncbi:hypothetical protein LDENG_00106220 [Lucifuga dentata]|nr:hypothetical protein LDENG_00106220 [Lucifuga dentata]
MKVCDMSLIELNILRICGKYKCSLKAAQASVHLVPVPSPNKCRGLCQEGHPT